MPRNNVGTILTDAEGNNRTASHLSTNIVILVEGNTVGAVQTLAITEERGGIKMIDEVGTDGHIDSAPNASTNINVTCNRVRFDRMRIAEAFSRGFLHVHSQRIPFDIEIHDRFHDSDAGNAIITTIKNCWIQRINYTYSATDFVISDEMTVQAEAIYSVLNSNNVAGPAANGRQNNITINPFEADADRGDFRGALDAAGLLDAVLQD